MRNGIGGVIAEFFGTAILVLFGLGSIFAAGNPLGVALAFGLAVILAASTGAHVNPAVTLGSTLARETSLWRAPSLIVAQLAGATVAAFALKWLFPEAIWEPVKLGTPQLAPGVGELKGLIIETTLTAIVVFAALMKSPIHVAFRIGLAVTVGVLVFSAATGASMNPARAFGPALATMTWTHHWLYWLAGLAGGIIGFAAAKLTTR